MTLPRFALSISMLPTVLVLMLTGAALADGEPLGPRIGNNGFKAEIDTGPQGADSDDFVAALLEGESLSVDVVSPFQSGLIPQAQLADPDGVLREDAAFSKRGVGKRLKLKRFPVDRTGYWVVSVAGDATTQGVYVVKSSVRKMKTVERRDLSVGGAGAETLEIELPGMDLARLDLVLKWAKGGVPVQLVSLRAPDGSEVMDGGARLIDAAKVKSRSVVLKKASLLGGLGTYTLTVSAATAAVFDLRYRVRPTDRPRGGTQKLAKVEPYIDPVVTPMRGVAGLRVVIRGRNFAFPQLPRVFFDGREASIEERNEVGSTLTVNPPEGIDNTVVRVDVVNPDGQGFRSENHFYYVPQPTVTGLFDLAGDPVLGGASQGGRRVLLRGTFFQSGVRVRFGSNSVATLLHSSTEMEVTTPAGVPGDVPVVAFDSFKHEAEAPDVFTYKDPPAFDPLQPFSPAVASSDTEMLILVNGSAFAAGDTVLVDGEPAATSFGAETLLGFTLTPRSAGTYAIAIVDRFGTATTGPSLRVKDAPTISAAAVTGGPLIGTKGVPLEGGSVLTLTGTNFDVDDVVTIGGVVADSSATANEMTVTVPPGIPGDADLVLTDVPGNQVTVEDAVRYVGYVDKTADRTPGSTDFDDLSAMRGVIGDLDDDGDANDLSIVSDASAPGTRTMRTRLFLNDGSGGLLDETNGNLPTPTPDAFNGADLAIGDLDGGNGVELVLAFVPGAGSYAAGIRLLENDGAGSFTQNTDWEPPGIYSDSVYAQDEHGNDWLVYDAVIPYGQPTALAVGDLDGDDDLDVILGRDRFESRYVYVDPAYVDFSGATPYVSNADANAYLLQHEEYWSATRVYDNRITDDEGFADVTSARLPTVGTSDDATPLPAFHAADLALADLDGDDDLDLVVTWPDPTTVTPAGLDDTDSARIATRILTNNGSGVFTDVTSTFLPAASSPEYFQAHRVALADLDGDGDVDIVLVHETDLNDFQGTPTFNRHALRILRNDGDTATPRFSDATTASLPALPSASNDNFRGGALAISDVDGDGTLDILVGATTSVPEFSDGSKRRATRLLRGQGSLVFVDHSAFLPVRSDDSGEADDILLGDLAGGADPSLVLASETAPPTRTDGEILRVFEWLR